MITTQPTAPAAPPVRVSQYRWVICALLFFATTINYIDRQILGLLKPTLMEQFKWTETDYGNIVFAFQAAYAVGLVTVGRLMDWVGTRRGYAFSITFWSLAAMAHALARTVGGFCVARFTLGLGEAGNFPAAIKTVSEWFPKRERAFATGIFNAGSNIGATVAPMLVPWLTLSFGWRVAFIITGALGFVWLAFWLMLYRKPEDHPRVSPGELALIKSDPAETDSPLSWKRLVPHRQTWAFAIGKFLTDPVWWFYLYWVPGFLYDHHKLDLKSMGLPLVVIYLLADVGSVGGGWLSSHLIRRGWSINAARKTAMLVCALAVVPIVFASKVTSLWAAVALISLAAAAHQGWSANLFTTVSDMFPKRAVGSVVGIGGTVGAIGGMFVAKAVGYILDATNKNYLVLFLTAGLAYLLALLLIHLLTPRLMPATLGTR